MCIILNFNGVLFFSFRLFLWPLKFRFFGQKSSPGFSLEIYGGFLRNFVGFGELSYAFLKLFDKASVVIAPKAKRPCINQITRNSSNSLKLFVEFQGSWHSLFPQKRQNWNDLDNFFSSFKNHYSNQHNFRP